MTEVADFLSSMFNLPDICLSIKQFFEEPYLVALQLDVIDTKGSELTSSLSQGVVSIDVHVDCLPPMPFFGACCINSTWQTRLPDEVMFPEYIISLSPVNVTGTDSPSEVHSTICHPSSWLISP